MSSLQATAAVRGVLRSAIETGVPNNRGLLIGGASLVTWPLLTAIVRDVSGQTDFYGVPFALAAVLLASWYGGLSTGLAVAILSVVFLELVLPASRVIDAPTESAWHIVVFLLCAVLIAGFQSAHRRYHDRLEEEGDYKEAFLTLMSHELRTPTTMIFSGVRILRRRRKQMSDEEVSEVLDGIDLESEHLSEMIDDLLLLFRLPQRRHDSRSTVDIVGAVREACIEHGRRWPEKVIELEAPEEPCLAIADERYLQTVLRHLLANSQQYSPAADPVVVTVNTERDDARVSVRDFGRGLRDDERERIFEPFYRGHFSPVTTRGLGLGLTLCKRAVEAMNGKISARSPGGVGLEVTITLHRQRPVPALT